MENGILSSHIIPAGSKFTVADGVTDSTFGQGTTGFVCFVKGHGVDYPNIVYFKSVVIRRGKGGKKRLDDADLSCPIFNLPAENFDKLLPDDRTKHFVRINIEAMNTNVMDMDSIEFLGWALAYTKYVHKLSRTVQGVKGKMPMWPADEKHPLNDMLRVEMDYTESPQDVEDNYNNPAKRESFVKEMRIIESTLKTNAVSYMRKLSQIECSALRKILATCGTEKDILNRTIKAFDKKEQGLSKLLELNRTQRKG